MHSWLKLTTFRDYKIREAFIDAFQIEAIVDGEKSTAIHMLSGKKFLVRETFEETTNALRKAYEVE